MKQKEAQASPNDPEVRAHIHILYNNRTLGNNNIHIITKKYQTDSSL